MRPAPGRGTAHARLLERGGRREEEAVRAAADEVLEMFFRYRQIG